MTTAPLRPRPENASARGPLDSLPEVTIVTSQACHLCEDALEELAGRADQLTLTVVPADTPAGRELVQWHLPTMFPLVLFDGLFLSSGRLPRRKLDKVLDAWALREVTS
jgi:hypothetical protein